MTFLNASSSPSRASNSGLSSFAVSVSGIGEDESCEGSESMSRNTVDPATSELLEMVRS